MKKIKICSPEGIQNKEKYLNESLERFKNRKIALIEKNNNGDIEISLEKGPIKVKYFAKVIKTEKPFKIGEICNEEWYQNIMKHSIMMEHIEYKGFCVLFFKK